MPDGAGDAFTLLTTEPSPDAAPIHDRQMVVLNRSDWLAWLDLTRPEPKLGRRFPPGALPSSKCDDASALGTAGLTCPQSADRRRCRGVPARHLRAGIPPPRLRERAGWHRGLPDVACNAPARNCRYRTRTTDPRP
jgi:hypothetical protein